jgi:cyanuric acid amidohydrolase
MYCIGVHKIGQSGPGDLTGLQALINSGDLVPDQIIAVLGKTEGNGSVNDFTREYASVALATYLGGLLKMTPKAVEKRIAFVMSGGTEGILSPHLTIFTRTAAVPVRHGPKRLVAGIAFTRELLPEELGRMAQVDATAEAVLVAMRDAGITDPGDVHFVQIKCPLLTAERINAAMARNGRMVTHDTYESMGYSRGASALGAAFALGEVQREQLSDACVTRDWSHYSSVASTSSGVELMYNAVIVFGNAIGSPSPFICSHTVMRDAIDADSVRRAIEALPVPADHIVNLFAKAEADPSGTVRGSRHTMLDDSDINQTRHARAVVGGVLASIIGDTMIFVSGGAEHQGPPGGGPVAIIARTGLMQAAGPYTAGT